MLHVYSNFLSESTLWCVNGSHNYDNESQTYKSVTLIYKGILNFGQFSFHTILHAENNTVHSSSCKYLPRTSHMTWHILKLGQYLTTSLLNPGLYSTIEEINYMYYFQIYSDNLDCFYIKENMTRMPKTLAKRDWVHTQKKPANTFQNYTSIQVI